jgi:predicted kinase
VIVLLTGPPGAGKTTLAALAVDQLDATILGWDWVMAALTSCEPVTEALAGLDPSAHRRVGWSVMENLARAQVRLSRNVVLDGVARDEEVAAIRRLGRETGAAVHVVVTECSDRALLRKRIEQRHRNIPGWHELEWARVEAFLADWVAPAGHDLLIDTAEPDEATIAFARALSRW